MGIRTAATGQYFNSPAFVRARFAMRALFVVLGIAAAAAVALPDQGIIAIMAGLVGLVLSLIVRLWGRGTTEKTSEGSLFWGANSFSFLLMGGLLIPGGIYLDQHPLAEFVVSGVAALALLAGVVGFCAGRFLYLLVIAPTPAAKRLG